MHNKNREENLFRENDRNKSCPRYVEVHAHYSTLSERAWLILERALPNMLEV